MDVVEPYLLQLGFLDRTAQGRIATKSAYEAFEIADIGKRATAFTIMSLRAEGRSNDRMILWKILARFLVIVEYINPDRCGVYLAAKFEFPLVDCPAIFG